MFQLHETTRRSLCRAGFCLACLLPTGIVLGYSALVNAPLHVAGSKRQLASLLGLEVSLADVSHPRPGVTLYHGLEVADPDTGRRLLSCRMLEAGRSSGGLVLTASQPVIHPGAMPRLGQLLLARLRRQTAGWQTPLDLSPCDVTWHSPGGPQTFTGVSGYLESAGRKDTLSLRFTLAGIEMSEPATIRVVRARGGSSAATRFDLSTGGTPLPCSLASPLADTASWLGPRCRFTGRFWADDAGGDWEGELTGRFFDIDLDSLVSHHFPHRLSGTAELDVREAVFNQGRLTRAAGKLTAGAGLVSRSLLASARQHLEMPAAATSAAADPLPFAELGLGFLMNGQTLELSGLCEAGRLGTVLYGDPIGPVLAQPDGPRGVVQIVRMLVPASQVQVPASRETDALVRRLPVPSLMPPVPGDRAQPEPSARLRVKPQR
ncbi:MAG: hypothetical protein WD278_16440 [Pirellulales bacterium]